MTAFAVHADSTPALGPAVAMVTIGSDIVAWPSLGGPVVADRLVAALLPHLDGRTPLKELVDDLAVVTTQSDTEVWARVGPGLEACSDAGVIVGLLRSSTSRVHDDAQRRKVQRIWSDPTDPNAVIEELVDGRTVRTVSVTLSTSDPLLDSTSLIDVLPADSCLGAQLRVGTIADVIVVRTGEAHVGVRSTHQPTTDLLLAKLGDRAAGSIVTTAAGPAAIHAYVIGPLEGSGPPRVFDRFAQRVGRPRSASDATTIVGHLLNEAESPAAPGTMVKALPIVIRDECVLLADPLRDAPLLTRELRRRSLDPAPTRRCLIDASGTVTIEGPFPDGRGLARQLSLRGVVAYQPRGYTSGPMARALSALLTGVHPPSAGGAQAVLQSTADALATTEVVLLSGQDSPRGDDIARTVQSLLGAHMN